MTRLYFALSIHKFVSSVGDYIGFAALLAVALLVILYFAHARENATLRERLEDANDRIVRLETRVAQLLQLQSLRAQQGAQQQPGVVKPPRLVRGVAGAGAVAPARAGATPGGAALANGQAELGPAAPAGVGAPALASATKMVTTVGDGTVNGAAPADEQATVIGAAAAASSTATDEAALGGAPDPGENGQGSSTGELDDDALAATNVELPLVERPEPAVAAAIVANPFSRGTGAGDSLPRVQLRSQEQGGGSRSLPRRSVPLPEPIHPTTRRRGLRTVAGVLAALVIVAGVVFALVKLTSGGSSKATKPVAVKTTKTAVTTTFNPATVKVAVLNGTAVAGLAKDVSNYLAKKGFARANVTNGPSQTEVTTVVSYIPGEKVAAQHVATALGLQPSAVVSATASVISSCDTTPTSTTTTCSGDVIVTVGSDQEKLAGTASGSAG